jgi:hypothetical protein
MHAFVPGNSYLEGFEDPSQKILSDFNSGPAIFDARR